MEKAAKAVLRQIKADTRKGIGYDGKPFPQLKDSTIDRREVLEDYNSTHGEYDSTFSNVTFMGDTVNKLESKVKIGLKKGKIILLGVGKHKLMKGPRGTLKGSNADINDILNGLENRGWKIRGASKESRARVRKLFIRYLRRKT